MARKWAPAEVASVSRSLILRLLHDSPIAVTVVALVAMAALVTVVVGLCAQIHSRVQNKEGSDEERSGAASRRDQKHADGYEGEQAKRFISVCFAGSASRFLLSKRVPHADEEDEGVSEMQVETLGLPSGPVWKRSILMGERCEPPAFSGRILYDEHGNLVQELPWRSPLQPPSPSLQQLLLTSPP